MATIRCQPKDQNKLLSWFLSLIKNFSKSKSDFFKQYPAFLYALAATVGAASILFHWSYIFCLLFIAHRIYFTYAIACAIACLTYISISLPDSEVEFKGRLTISSLTLSHSPFGSRWSYLGTLTDFSKIKNVPVSILLPERISRPPANQDYLVKGKLITRNGKRYQLKIDLQDPWIPVKGSYSLAEWRYHAKEWLAQKISDHVKNKDSAAFLTGIATGEFDDPLLHYEFSRFGLQHIMAISGFHFSLITTCLTIILQLLFRQRSVIFFVIILMSAYFIFLGPGPSILRAYFTILISLTSGLIKRSTSGINALGFAVFLLITYDPLLITTIGFPFSALTTAAILLFYPLFYSLLDKIFPKRPLSAACLMTPFQQHGYTLLHFARQSIALTLAVNILAIPLTLFFFGSFPTLSIIYNLFFPFLVSLSMMLLLASLILVPIAPYIFSINNKYTHTMLSLTSNLPTHFDFNIQTLTITPLALTITLFALLYIAIKGIDKKAHLHAKF